MKLGLGLLMVIGAVTLAHANDMPGSLVWTDLATFSTYPFIGVSCFPAPPSLPACISVDDRTMFHFGPLQGTFISTSNGLDTFFSLHDAFPTVEFALDRTFTVTSPGWFYLSNSISFGGNIFRCDATACAPAPMMGATLTTTSTIIGSGAPFVQSLSDSGVGTAVGDPYFDILVLNDQTAPTPVYLGLGDYTLQQDYSQSLFALSSTFLDTGVSFETDLVPTPEPNGYALGLCLGLAIMLPVKSWRQSRSRRASSTAEVHGSRS